MSRSTSERRTVKVSNIMPIGRDGRRGPSPKQQQAFNALKEFDFLFYGGAGGGGKSFFLRWACLKMLLEWWAQGLARVTVGLFSLDYPTLEDRQIGQIAREFPDWLGKLKDTKTDGLGFYLHPEYGGGILKLRNLDKPEKYRSSEFAGIAVEELPENEIQTFDDLFWRLRWPRISRTKFIAAGNPEGPGLWWVKQLWIDRDFTGDLKRFDVEVPAIEGRPAYRMVDQFAFCQALHSDNPNLDPSYEATKLNTLPEMRRLAVKDGLWTVFKGQMFGEWRAEVHSCKPFEIPEWWTCWIGNDAAQKEPASWHLYAASPLGQVYVIREWTFRDAWYTDQARTVAASLKSMGRNPAMLKVSGLDSFANDRVARGKSIVDLYAEGGLPGWERPNPDGHPGRKQRAGIVSEYLRPYDAGGVTTARLQVFHTCPDLIRTLPMLVSNPDHPDEVLESAIDHWFDDLSYALTAWHRRRSVAPTQPRYKPGTAGDVLKHRDIFEEEKRGPFSRSL